MEFAIAVIGVLVGCGVGFAIAFLATGKSASRKLKAAELEAEKLVNDARRQSETLIKEARLEAKDKLLKMTAEFEAETKETRGNQQKREQRLLQKEESIDRKIAQVETRENTVTEKERLLGKREDQIQESEQQYKALILRTEGTAREDLRADLRTGQGSA